MSFLIKDLRLKIWIEIWDFGLEITIFIVKYLRFCITGFNLGFARHWFSPSGLCI